VSSSYDPQRKDVLPFYILREAITTNTISMPAEQLVLLQQFIQPQDDHIVRVETIGGKVIYTMKVFATSAFNPCPYLQMSNKLVDEGKLKNFTGVDDPYEEPEHPELVVETDKETVEESVAHIFARLVELGYLAPEVEMQSFQVTMV